MGALSAPQFCRIEQWRGYVTSSFCVRLPDGTVLESPPFRWRHRAPPPDDGSARAAYDELVGRLEDAGWTRDADGADWFGTAFTRLVEIHGEVALQPRPEAVPAQPPPAPIVPPGPEPPREVDLPAVRQQLPAEPPPRPVSNRRWSRIAIAAGVALVAATLASGALLRGHDGHAKPADMRPAAVRQALHVQPTTTPATELVTKSVAQVPAQRRVVDVRIAAHGTGSWVEVRRTSATGVVLYSATLADQQTLHFRAPKLWARFGAASNLTITSDGRPVQLQGTYDKLFLPQPA